MAAGGEVEKTDRQKMDSLSSQSESELQSSLTKQELSPRQPIAVNAISPDDGENDVSKSEKPHGVHNRKSSTASDDSKGGHGFIPGLMKKLGFGSHELKDKDIHASDAHLSSMPRSSSHEVVRVGEGHRHHRHGTRDKEIFGSEDADENFKEHPDVFGCSNSEFQQGDERDNSMFGFEDTEFERREKGCNLFGSDDLDTSSFRERITIVGPADADDGERTRNVFGDDNAIEEEEEDDDDDNRKREKKGHNGHSVSD